MSAEGFAAVPNWMVRDETISLYAVTVYMALASHSGPGGIHPSRPTLAKEARCSESSVGRALVELEALGVVQRVRRKSKVGRASNGYVLLPNGVLAVDETADEVPVTLTDTSEVPVTGTAGSGQGRDLVPLTEEEPLEEDPPVVPRGDELFERAWAHWPKKTERKLSRERFLRVLPSHPTLANEVVMFGDAYAETTETKFVPALAVWINRERWSDPLPSGGGKRSTVAHGRDVDELLAARERKAVAS